MLPFQRKIKPAFKLDVFDAVASIPTAIASLIGGRNDRKSQERINEQNIAMQRETNALNEKLYREGLVFSDQQRQAQERFNAEQAEIAREWNSEQAQMQRALKAGLNPFLTASQIAGTSSPAASPTGMPTASPPQMVAPRAEMIDGTAIRSATLTQNLAAVIGTLAQAGKVSAEKRKIQKTLGRVLDQMDAEIENLSADTDVKRADKSVKETFNDLQKLSLNFERQTYDWKVDSSEKEREILFETAHNMRLTAKKIIGEIEYLSKQGQQIDSTIKLNDATIKHLGEMDAQGWQNLETLAYQAVSGRISAEAADWAAHNPQSTAGMLCQFLGGLLGTDTPAGTGAAVNKAINEKLDKVIPKLPANVRRDMEIFLLANPITSGQTALLKAIRKYRKN